MLRKSPFRARISWQSACYFTFPGSFTSAFFLRFRNATAAIGAARGRPPRPKPLGRKPTSVHPLGWAVRPMGTHQTPLIQRPRAGWLEPNRGDLLQTIARSPATNLRGRAGLTGSCDEPRVLSTQVVWAGPSAPVSDPQLRHHRSPIAISERGFNRPALSLTPHV